MDFYKQICLRFENDTIYKVSKITSELLAKYPSLGNEIILPINMQEGKENVPIFIFSQNPDFNINGNFYNLIIRIKNKTYSEIKEIIEYVFSIFKENGNNFVGIALIEQEKIEKEKIPSFKNHFFTNIDTIDNDSIHLSLVREIEINNKKIRCLEGYSTLDNDFVSHFEFNMKKTDFEILDLKYIFSFLEQSLAYKEERERCF